LRPAAAPIPALKHELLPGVRDRRPGNAAVHYGKIGEVGMTVEEQDWFELPLADLPRDKVRAFLDSHRNALDDIELAARRETCDWQLPIHEREMITLRLPEAQKVRGFARLLALQARWQIAEGRLDEALETLRTGVATGRHIARGQTLVSGLVGIAICNLMLK